MLVKASGKGGHVKVALLPSLDYLIVRVLLESLAQIHDINKRQKWPQNHMDLSFGHIEKNRSSTIEEL